MQMEKGIINIKPLLLTSFGALVALFFFRRFNEKTIVRKKDYLMVSILGALTFLPQLISTPWALMTSIYLWQLTIGHYLTYLKKTVISHEKIIKTEQV